MPSGSPVVPRASSAPSARSSCGGGWPALHQRRRRPSAIARKVGTNRPSGSREQRIALVCWSTSAGRSQSNVRASTKKRTIAAVAATSSPLPLTSPTSSPRPPPGSVQIPNTSPPEAWRPAGS